MNLLREVSAEGQGSGIWGGQTCLCVGRLAFLTSSGTLLW